MRSIFSRFALLLVVSLVCLTAIEVGYRVVRGIPLGGDLSTDAEGNERLQTFRKSTNDLLVYEPIPNAITRLYDVENAINSFGMRDREVTLEKPSGVFRIALLGDSVVYGMGLEAEEMLSRQLEHALAGSQVGRFEVLNFAVPGYSTQQEIELYRSKVRAFEPDLVVLVYCLNDDREESGEIRLFDGAHFSIFRKFYFPVEIRSALRPVLRDVFGVETLELEAQARIAENFRKLRTSLESDTKLVVVVFPYLTDYVLYDFKKEHRRVTRLAERNGFVVIDLLPVFSKHKAEALRLEPDDLIHPNRTGTEIAAHTMADSLRAQSLVPVSGSARGRHR
jgi:lysophospholipase L1-like esterase